MRTLEHDVVGPKPRRRVEVKPEGIGQKEGWELGGLFGQKMSK